MLTPQEISHMALDGYALDRKPRHWFSRRAAAAIVAVSALATGVTVAAPQAQAAGGYQAPIRSGNAWPTGVWYPDWDTAPLASFETYRNRPLDVAIAWPPRTTWADFTSPNSFYTTYSGHPYTMVFGIPLVPEGDSSATMAGCAAGSYTSKWTTFGQTLNNAGLGSSIIRLGWEMNGDWYKWGGGDPATYVSCFQKVVTAIRAVSPNLKFDWTVNRGNSAGMPGDEVYAAYPGDAYVDIVGIDSYDSWVDWDGQLNGYQGLKEWLAFAIAHGKKLSVPEWGLFRTDTHGNGDNPTYIQNMYDFFKTNAANLAYEAYFNDFNEGDGLSDSLWNPIQVPLSSAKYKALYSTPTTTPPTGGEVTTAIQDTNTGTTNGTVQFSAGWGQCTTTCANASDNSYLWTATVGSTATVRFTGHQFKWFGMKEPFSTIATVSIDGGAAVDVDPYSATTSSGTVQLYASPVLTEGAHTAVITMTSRRNANSTGGSSITFDRADVLSGSTSTTSLIQDTATGTTTGTVQLSAGWGQCTTTCANASDNSYLWTATVGSTATVRFKGHQVKWFGMKEPFSTIATVSIDGAAAVDVDPYSATTSSGTVQLYASPTLSEGTHTAVITMTSRRNANSTGGSSITFDRAEVISTP